MRNLPVKTLSLVVSNKITPPWLLYFLRLVNAAQGDHAKAWKMLPHHLPKSVRCPTMNECVAVLAIHGLA